MEQNLTLLFLYFDSFPNFTSKATAIQNNLQSFTEEQQFKIIKELCESVLAQNPANKDVAKILKLLLKIMVQFILMIK